MFIQPLHGVPCRGGSLWPARLGGLDCFCCNSFFSFSLSTAYRITLFKYIDEIHEIVGYSSSSLSGTMLMSCTTPFRSRLTGGSSLGLMLIPSSNEVPPPPSSARSRTISQVKRPSRWDKACSRSSIVCVRTLSKPDSLDLMVRSSIRAASRESDVRFASCKLFSKDTKSPRTMLSTCPWSFPDPLDMAVLVDG